LFSSPGRLWRMLMYRFALLVIFCVPIFSRADEPQLINPASIRDEEGQIAFQHKVPLSALVPTEDKPEKPVGPAAISTADAKKKIGEKVTIELTVQSTGSSGKRIFLNSEKSFRDEKNFTIMIDMDKAGAKFKEAKIDDPRKHFDAKTIRVTGTVSKYQE